MEVTRHQAPGGLDGLSRTPTSRCECGARVLSLGPQHGPLPGQASAQEVEGVVPGPPGIDPKVKCYVLGEPPHYKIVRSEFVHFNENEFPCRSEGGGAQSDQPDGSGDGDALAGAGRRDRPA